MWRRQNPLDTEITRQNCAALGIPGYFDVVERSMSLQVINVGPGGRREGGREGGIQVINVGVGAEREGGREGGYGQAWSVVGGPGILCSPALVPSHSARSATRSTGPCETSWRTWS